MKIEVWSDIACPFCYIGKRHLEQALQQVENAPIIELEWKSFQLDPDLKNDSPYASTYAYLAERKGISYDQAKELTAGVRRTGEAAGVTLNFEKTIIANTLDAHRLLHFAKTKRLAHPLKELLFRAHFTNGANIGDRTTLIAIATEAGLDTSEVSTVLEGDQFMSAVQRDIDEAHNIGIRGVPFFVFNRKYAISGAQPVSAFSQTLNQAISAWRAEQNIADLKVSEGPSCRPEGACD